MKKILATLLFLFPGTVQAVGVSVQPSKLELFFPDKSAGQIIIKNISAEPITVLIYPDDFINSISVNPSELELWPEQSSPVQIGANFSGESAGLKNTNLSVVASARDKRSFNAASGIKIPITITTREDFWAKPIELLAGGALVTVIFVVLMVINKDRRKLLRKDLE